MNIVEVKKRNKLHIEGCVVKYGFDLNAEEIFNLANIYSQNNLSDLTVRIIGEKKIEEVVETKKGTTISVKTKVKYTKVPLFSFTKKNVNAMQHDQAIEVFKDIHLISIYHTELKMIKKLEELENSAEAVKCLENIFNNLPKI